MALNALRKGAKSGIVKFFLMGFMTLAVAGLVMMDMGGFFRGGVPVDTVAKVGGEELKATRFDNTVRSALSRQGLDQTTAYQLGFIHQILNSEINRGLLYNAGNRLGLQISDSTLARQINRLIEPLVTEDLTKRQALERILFNQGMSEAQFVQALRTEITNTTLRNAIQLSGGYIPATEAALLYQYQNEQRSIEAIYLPDSSVTAYEEPTDEVLLPFYQVAQERYVIPENRRFTIATLSHESLKDSVAVSDELLRDIYQEDIDLFQVGERRVMSQAILPDEATAKSVVAALDQQEKDLQKAVESVTGDSSAFLGEDEFSQDGLVSDIATEAFAAQPGDIVGPIETPLGWHVLIVKKLLPPKTKPFEEVKAQLKEEIIQDRLLDQMYETSAAIDDSLAGGTPLEEVVKMYDLKMTEVGPVLDDGATLNQKDGLTAYPEDRAVILETAFAMLEGETSPVFELSDGSYAVIRLEEIQVKSYKPFEEVKDDLGKVWIADQQNVLNRQRARESLRQLANGDTTLAETANLYDQEIKQIKITRGKKAEPPLTEEAQQTFLSTEQGAFAMAEGADGVLIGKVTDITLPGQDDMTEETLASLEQQAENQLQQEYLASYLQWLREKSDVEINESVLQTLYGPESDSY